MLANTISERRLIDEKVNFIRRSALSKEDYYKKLARHSADLQKANQLSTAKLRDLADRFVDWATANQIPYDFDTSWTYDCRNVFERLFAKPPKWQRFSGVSGWRLAEIIRVTDRDDIESQVKYLLGVDTKGSLGVTTNKTFYRSDLQVGVSDEYLIKFSPDMIHLRIAEICYKYSISWS